MNHPHTHVRSLPPEGADASLGAARREASMQWTTPGYTDLRFGFEITMYIANR
jgi:coenzyme PQQ precursor peptide PqqA